MDKLEHILIGEKQIDLIFIVAKINTMVDKINNIQEILYKVSGEF